ncbi:hypothetical protein GGH95_002510 [Coemansia sp. RSA 1836]|nr:hypothetical protein IWW47_005958 [Coemansia sp. RSA 2052]KAJ2580594.1 hypothetical protein GGH95_002510 [Coemansia sp. RSA 1836]
MDNVNRATGAAKEQLGKTTGNESMQTEGRAQNTQARGEQQMNRAKESADHAFEQGKSAMKQAGDKAKQFGGDVKQKVGEVFGSQRTANEGRVDQAQASAKDAAHGAQKGMHDNLK